MVKSKAERTMLVEHVLEVRHVPSGTFLDIRGYIADYVRQKGLFPHWKIDSNVVNFRDDPKSIKLEGAFVGYKNLGYVALNPQTRNYFVDRAISFWKSLINNERYKIPELTRFGTRTKIFMPLPQTFSEINKMLFEALFTEKARSLIGGKEKDFQFTIELRESDFDLRIGGGPIHKDEAGKYFQFESSDFAQCGMFLDLDYFKEHDLELSNVPKLLKEAITLTWHKAEQIASDIGL